MSIEEKAKAYDEAIERFKSFKEKYYTKSTYLGDMLFDKTGEMQKDFEEIFPQLRESEDEIHRKWILEYLYDGLRKTDEQFKDHFKSAIDWLEKQKEQDDKELSEKIVAAYQLGRSDERKQQEQKSAWSEEDEKIRKALIAFLEMNTGYFSCNGFTKDDIIQWLKSIRPQPKQEWSEEDEKIIDTIISVLGQYINYKTVSGSSSGYATPMYSKEIDWLRSLRPSWKPSEEQMEVFQNTMQRLLRAGGTGKWYAILESLYEQLKKL